MKYSDLMNNIINNYYDEFRKGNKSLCLTFYYNYKYSDVNLIPNISTPISDPRMILLHLDFLLDFYIEQKFKCNIKINDELWLTDLKYRDKIIDIFIEKFRNSAYKPEEIIISSNVIHCLGEKKTWFIDLINKFNDIEIKVKLHFETMLIDIVTVEHLFNIKDFLLTYVNKLKIRINPNNFVYFTEVFDSIYSTFNNILYLYEEDNVNWTDYKINEYIEFLDKYIDKIYAENNNIEFLKQLLLNEKLNLISLNINSKKSCPFYQSLNILLEDLSVNLCPKFQYSNQTIGKYIYDNKKIIALEFKSVLNIFLKDLTISKCNTCPFNIFCKTFCCKESFKYCLNPIVPIQASCKMKKTKYAFLFFKLKELDLMTIENLQQIPNIDLNQAKNILDLYNKIIQRI